MRVLVGGAAFGPNFMHLLHTWVGGFNYHLVNAICKRRAGCRWCHIASIVRVDIVSGCWKIFTISQWTFRALTLSFCPLFVRISFFFCCCSSPLLVVSMLVYSFIIIRFSLHIFCIVFVSPLIASCFSDLTENAFQKQVWASVRAMCCGCRCC